MNGYQAPRCCCGHVQGAHRSSGTGWPHPITFGVCLTDGCDCPKFQPAPTADRDGHDALQDARAEIAGETGDRPSMRTMVAASLTAPHGAADYYHLRDVARHPFGLPTGAPSSAGMTPNAAAAFPPLRAAAADGSSVLPDAA